ncbi:hypothetical protein CGMCC3_g3064 [Colletotrichum fructicola]|nr:uncharacterized protein CGMCC3_g3064 [Colletotrichum fructicola]KAE9580848.1 hypothetical protein CGMCC3_g3064 [Colletotrichum fructicola]
MLDRCQNLTNCNLTSKLQQHPDQSNDGIPGGAACQPSTQNVCVHVCACAISSQTRLALLGRKDQEGAAYQGRRGTSRHFHAG